MRDTVDQAVEANEAAPGDLEEPSVDDDLYSGDPVAEPGAEKSLVLPLKGCPSLSSASHVPTSQPAGVGAKLIRGWLCEKMN